MNRPTLSTLCFLTLFQSSPDFYVSAVLVFRKHCGKRRNCSSKAISTFTKVFSTLLENVLPFLSNLKLSSANSSSLEKSRICHLGKSQQTNFHHNINTSSWKFLVDCTDQDQASQNVKYDFGTIPSPSLVWICIHQSFSRTFSVFDSDICKFECNLVSDWLNHMVWLNCMV